MAPLYQEYFGLDRPPFDKAVLDSELWLPSGKQDLVEDILDALRARESVLLYGESGVGKTCVLRVLRHRIGNDGFRLTYCHNAPLGRRDFYRQLCRALALPDVQARIKGLGGEVGTLTLDSFAAMNRAEFERYGKLVRDANIKAE